jgi:hypothetical protein
MANIKYVVLSFFKILFYLKFCLQILMLYRTVTVAVWKLCTKLSVLDQSNYMIY